jgi:peroxiredoxin
MRRINGVIATLGLLCASWPHTLHADHASRTASIGRVIKDFTLADHRGKKYALEDFADKDVIVVAFLGNECPLCKQYGPRLEQLAQEFADRGVAFLGINSNQQDAPSEMAAYGRTCSITFPLLKDPGNVVADMFAAERVPEVFVLDKSRKICYRGRIDDQYGLTTGSGYARPKVRNRDLASAIEDTLAGKKISQPMTEASGCLIGRVARVAPHGEITYSKHISRLLEKHCVECHRPGEVAPFSLLDYAEVSGWAAMIREVIDEGRMPPWFANPEVGHFANDARLTSEEKAHFREWVDNGCPQGDPQDLPPPRSFPTGWQMCEPDQVIYMRDEPFTVPADGVVDYQYFVVDPHFTEDKWVQAAEARPGNRSVVHHMIAFVQPPPRRDKVKFDFIRGGGLVSYTPGDRARIYPEGVAAYVPAGSKLVFQMHYTPIGSKQEDRSYIGLKFADPSTVKRRARGGAAANRRFTIQPGANDQRVVALHTFDRDTLLATMLPHMHLRGKSFRYVAKFPNGTSETLLDVPRYDFNWQLRYELTEPKLMPRGTVLECTAHFDNSEENLANPDPKSPVRWGDQAFDEMMIGFFSTLPVTDDVSTDDK